MMSDKVGVCFMVNHAGHWEQLTEDEFVKLPDESRCLIYNSAVSWRRYYEDVAKASDAAIWRLESANPGHVCDAPAHWLHTGYGAAPMIEADVLKARKRLVRAARAAAALLPPDVPPRAAADGEGEGEALLAAAAARSRSGDDAAPLRRKALALLGLAESAIPIGTTEQLIEAIAEGFPSTVIKALRGAGWTYELMDKVIVPRRTLMRRKSAGQTLTPGESDAAWRLAYVLAAASVVFASREAALAWLMRPKRALRDRSPAELLQSSVGTDHILSMLRRVDRGDFV